MGENLLIPVIDLPVEVTLTSSWADAPFYCERKFLSCKKINFLRDSRKSRQRKWLLTCAKIGFFDLWRHLVELCTDLIKLWDGKDDFNWILSFDKEVFEVNFEERRCRAAFWEFRRSFLVLWVKNFNKLLLLSAPRTFNSLRTANERLMHLIPSNGPEFV